MESMAEQNSATHSSSLSTSSSSGSAGQSDRRLLVVDGHSLAFRAYFALPADSFSTSDGQVTNAVYGFTTMLAQVLRDEKPSHVAIAFDVKGGTFRNRMLPQYKGTRDAAPEDLLSQLPLIQQVLSALDISFVEKEGFEGDDIIATLATMGEKAGYETFVLSGDRDAFQLVDQSITVLYPGHHFKDLKHMTPQAVFDKYKVWPNQYPDLAAMRGEQADNIPGVPGVGDGYAAKWINEFGSLQEIIDHADQISGKKGQALRDNVDQVRLNRRVNALVRDVDLPVSLDDFILHEPNIEKVNEVFSSLQFGKNTKTRILTAMAIAEGRDEKAAAVAASGLKAPVSSSVYTFSDGTEDINPANSEVIDPQIQTLPSSSDKRSQVINDFLSKRLVDSVTSTILTDNRQKTEGRVWVLSARGKVDRGTGHLRSLSVMTDQGQALVLQEADLHNSQVIQALGSAIKSFCGQLVVHDFKRLIHLLTSILPEISVDRTLLPLSDTRLEGYLVQPDATAKIETAAQYAQYFLHLETEENPQPHPQQGALDLGNDSDLSSQGSNEDNQPDQEDQAAQARRDARDAKECAYILALHQLFYPVLEKRQEISLLKDIELPVSTVLARMELTGAGVDYSRLRNMYDSFAAQAAQAEHIAWDQAGKQINLQSPKQLQAVLFDDMGLEPTRKTKSGGRTTNAAALQELYIRSVHNERANTFLGALLRHREVNKLKQIVQTLMDSVNTSDGRIHTTFEQTVAATGRLSSTDPNLQNIPNRNVEGREIRAAFVPSDGYLSLLSSDYSQVELRLMAHLSGDEALIEAFRSGADFHKYVASLVYQVPLDQITPDQRSHIKAMSYGLAYGLSTYGLAQQLGISPAQSDQLKAKYFSTFGKVHDYLESLVSQAKKRGYTTTMFGRRRYFPDLLSNRRQLRDAAQRAALNAPIQGSAADIMKIAMNKAATSLDEAGVKSRIILQIHDELVVELASGEEEEVTALVKNAMEEAVELAVPLDVSTGIGSDWQLAAH